MMLISTKLIVGIVVVAVVVLSHLQAVDISKWNLKENANRNSIDAAVIRYYEKHTFMMSISVCLEYSQLWQNYVQQYLSPALAKSKFMKYEIFMNNIDFWQQMKVFDHNLWYVDSFKAYRSLLRIARRSHSAKMGQYVVVMDAPKILNRWQQVKLILEKSWEKNIVDIVVAVYEGNATFVLYSYDMLKPHHCWQVVVEQVNVFQNGAFQNEELFPYKFGDFRGCPLTMYIRNSSLFYRFNLTQDGTQIASIEGLEANMIQTMAAKLNFQLKMLYSEKDDSVGGVYDNGSAVGPFRYLADNKLDVLLGYYDYPVRHRYFGESTSYAFMPLVIVFSEWGKTKYPQVWPFKPFTAKTWLIFGLLCLFVVSLVQFNHFYLGKSLVWLDVVGLVVGNSRPIALNMYMTKVSFFFCVFGMMILCAIFQGRLYYAFNTDSGYKITTVNQLVEANYTFLITRRFDGDIIRSLHIPWEQIRFVDATDDYFIYETIRKYPNNAATFTNYWDFQMYIGSKKCYDEFDILPLVVILNQICAYMNKQSHLIEPIDRVINSLKYGGILNKWLRDLTDEMVNTKKHQLTKKPLPLSAKKFQIIFTGLISLYLISILVFIGELAARNRTKIWRNFRKIKM